MRYPNLRHLEIFRTLSRTLSVTKTAQLLNVSQPAVSKAMSQLQDTVGLTLFNRVDGRLHPSSDALRLLAEAERVLNQVSLFRDEVDALQEARHGRLTVASIPALAMTMVASSIGRFMSAHPKVQIEFNTLMSYLTVEEVAQHRFELGFIHGVPQNPHVRSIFLGEYEICCQLRRDHPLASLDVIEPADISDAPLVFLDPASPPNHLIRESFAEAGIHPNVQAEVNASHLAAEIVQHYGVALVDPISASQWVAQDIVCRPFRPRVPLRIYAIHSAYRPMSRVSTVFLGIAEATIATRIEMIQKLIFTTE
ncbi:LysR family transcriptional regulator [Salinicola peritrichatus]|uniref:LysR family transcriptional regulator n=1 Tax=Salinicola peritrichatus TaxID=1267424 RepID=UPI000DA19CF9|nr:LysR family transcriptional regulator [Salinicola peritrichatus]